MSHSGVRNFVLLYYNIQGKGQVIWTLLCYL
jgi:hypothetical protein